MKNNTLTKELLTINPKAFKFLHDSYDFDFEKPFTIAKVETPFTFNKIEKLHGITKGYVLIQNTYWKDELSFFTFDGSGKEIYTNKENNAYCYKINNFNTKGDIEMLRKGGDNYHKCGFAFVLWQDEKNRTPKKERTTPNLLTRYKATFNTCLYPTKGTFINRYTLQNGKKVFSYEDGYYKGFTSESQIVDKSGYYVALNRDDLSRRANALRKERAKAKYNNTDFTNEICAILDKQDELKAHLLNVARQALNHEDMNRVEKITKKISWLYIDIDNLKKWHTEKAFSSVENFNKKYNYIIEKSSEILAM